MLSLLPCPFCGCKTIKTYAMDDDSFLKTISAVCDGCGCNIETKVDWTPFSKTRDRINYKLAWENKITSLWNKRFNEEDPPHDKET